MNESINKFSKLITELVLQRENLKESLTIWNNASDSEIMQCEETLKTKLPESYKVFIKKYGMLVFLGDEFIGSENPNVTLNNRSHNLSPYSYNFPKNFVSVYKLGNGDEFCLDTSQMKNNECPVVSWPSYNEDGSYDFISESFGDFILETVWNNLIAEGVELSQYQHLKPKNKGWNYEENNNRE